MRKNRNRGYQKLIVWNDAINYYSLTYDVFRSFPFELKSNMKDWVLRRLNWRTDSKTRGEPITKA